jgi:hypothetical protein
MEGVDLQQKDQGCTKETILVDGDDFIPYPNIPYFFFQESVGVCLSHKIVSIVPNRLQRLDSISIRIQ